MNLKEKLQQIARNKILKSQKNVSVEKVSKPRVAKTKKTIKSVASQKQLTYFPEIPVGFFGYSRPAEARPPTEKVRELTKTFTNTLKNKKATKAKKLRYVSNSNKKDNKRVETDIAQLFQCDYPKKTYQ